MAYEDMNIPIPVTNKDNYTLVPGYLIEKNPEKEGSNCKQKNCGKHRAALKHSPMLAASPM